MGHLVGLAAAGRFRPVDFDAFYTGAALLRDGHGARLYDLGLQAQYQLALLGRLPLNGHVLPFVSPPHLAVLLLPLAHLPLGAAFAVWTLLQLALVAWMARECVRPCATGPGRVTVLGALAAFPMLLVTVYKGQVSLLVLVGLLLWMRALRGGRDVVLAAALLAGTVKPQLVLVPLVVTACLRRGRALLLFAAGGAALAAVAAAVAGPESLTGFLDAARALDASFDEQTVYPSHMYNVKGALVLLGVRSGPVNVLAGLALLLALGAVAALCWRAPRDDGAEPLRLALALLLGVLCSPHLYYYDALLLVAVALAFDAHLRRVAPRWRPALLGAAYAVPLLFLETAILDLGGRRVRWPFVLMLAWGLLMVIELVRLRARAAAAPGG